MDVKTTIRSGLQALADAWIVGADDEIPHPTAIQCGDELFVVSGCQFVLVS